MGRLTKWQRSELASVLQRLDRAGEPVAFFGLSGPIAAYCVGKGYASIAERRAPMGTRYIKITAAGRQALSEGEQT